jgi:DNA-binding beta-propeller fold protein YncE
VARKPAARGNNLTTTVGSGEFLFRVAESWEQLPAGWSHRDVAGVAVDSRDNVYVFNRSEHPVIVYDREGRFLRSWGEGVFANAHGITIGPDDTVYCVDNVDHTVRIFTPTGELLRTIGTAGVGSDTGSGDSGSYLRVLRGAEPFNKPTQLAIAPSGDLYVTDGYANARVHCFSPDGALRFSWGGPGTGPGEFHIPHALAIDPAGRVLVCDRENSRIQVFAPDGAFLEQWADVNRPDDIVIGPDGTVYVVELGGRAGLFPVAPPLEEGYPPSRCSVFSLEGALLARWGTADACAPGSFYAPHGACLDSRGDLYVGEVTWTAGGNRGLVPPECHTLQKLVCLRG